MLLVYILVCCIPMLVLFLVIAAIGAAGTSVYRTGRRAYQDTRPMVEDMTEKAARAQQKGLAFARRGAALSESFEEIGGRWLFIAQSIQEAAASPVIRLASMAGKRAYESREKGV